MRGHPLSLTPFTQSLGSLISGHLSLWPLACWPSFLGLHWHYATCRSAHAWEKKAQWFSTFATVTTVYWELALIPFCSIHQYRLVIASSKITSPWGRDWDAIILIPSHSTTEPQSKCIIPIHYAAIFTQNTSSDMWAARSATGHLAPCAKAWHTERLPREACAVL